MQTDDKKHQIQTLRWILAMILPLLGLSLLIGGFLVASELTQLDRFERVYLYLILAGLPGLACMIAGHNMLCIWKDEEKS